MELNGKVYELVSAEDGDGCSGCACACSRDACVAAGFACMDRNAETGRLQIWAEVQHGD